MRGAGPVVAARGGADGVVRAGAERALAVAAAETKGMRSV